MMFERFAADGRWLEAFGVPVADPEAYTAAGRRMRRDALLVFSRWCQVMLRFEVELYRNPGQDLNKLWWDLVERYQMVPRPEGRNAPDYASKIHVVSAPAYYHNYMMGELFACQLHAAIARTLFDSDDPPSTVYTRDERVGKFMRERVFAPGRTLSWNELTRHATGEPLGAEAFAREFRGE
jgi:peptidyl-dipeptidase A